MDKEKEQNICVLRGCTLILTLNVSITKYFAGRDVAVFFNFGRGINISTETNGTLRNYYPSIFLSSQ